jgi:DNA-binding MarR family transcriptional regulator
MVLQPGAEWLAQQDLSRTAHRLLWLLVGLGATEGWVRLTQAEAAEKLSLDKSNVSRAFEDLERAGAVERGPRVSGSFTWRVSPSLQTGQVDQSASMVVDLAERRRDRETHAARD